MVDKTDQALKAVVERERVAKNQMIHQFHPS